MGAAPKGIDWPGAPSWKGAALWGLPRNVGPRFLRCDLTWPGGLAKSRRVGPAQREGREKGGGSRIPWGVGVGLNQ